MQRITSPTGFAGPPQGRGIPFFSDVWEPLRLTVRVLFYYRSSTGQVTNPLNYLQLRMECPGGLHSLQDGNNITGCCPNGIEGTNYVLYIGS